MIEAVFKPFLNNMITSTKAIGKAGQTIAENNLCSSPIPNVTLYTWMDNHLREHIVNLFDKSEQAFQISKDNKVRSKVQHLARAIADFLKVNAACQISSTDKQCMKCGDNVCQFLGNIRCIARKIEKICVNVWEH